MATKRTTVLRTLNSGRSDRTALVCATPTITALDVDATKRNSTISASGLFYTQQ
jgi:hypothetical protein